MNTTVCKYNTITVHSITHFQLYSSAAQRPLFLSSQEHTKVAIECSAITSICRDSKLLLFFFFLFSHFILLSISCIKIFMSALGIAGNNRTRANDFSCTMELLQSLKFTSFPRINNRLPECQQQLLSRLYTGETNAHRYSRTYVYTSMYVCMCVYKFISFISSHPPTAQFAALH